METTTRLLSTCFRFPRTTRTVGNGRRACCAPRNQNAARRAQTPRDAKQAPAKAPTPASPPKGYHAPKKPSGADAEPKPQVDFAARLKQGIEKYELDETTQTRLRKRFSNDEERVLYLRRAVLATPGADPAAVRQWIDDDFSVYLGDVI